MLITHQIKFAGDQVEVPGEGVIEGLQQVLPACTGLHNLRLLSFIISDSDIDFTGSHLPTSPPLASILNVGLDSEATFACEVPFSLFYQFQSHS